VAQRTRLSDRSLLTLRDPFRELDSNSPSPTESITRSYATRRFRSLVSGQTTGELNLGRLLSSFGAETMQLRAVVVCAVTCHFLAVSGRGDIISAWHFDTTFPDGNAARLADIGEGSALRLSATPFTYGGTTGNGSKWSLLTDNWSIGDSVQFTLSTVGRDSISVTWDQSAMNNSAPRDFVLQYSTGGVFTSVMSYQVSRDLWERPVSSYRSQSTRLFDFSSHIDIFNQPVVHFRLTNSSSTPINGSSVGPVGEIAIDNFIVSGSEIAAVPEPSSIALAAMLFVAAMTRQLVGRLRAGVSLGS